MLCDLSIPRSKDTRDQVSGILNSLFFYLLTVDEGTHKIGKISLTQNSLALIATAIAAFDYNRIGVNCGLP